MAHECTFCRIVGGELAATVLDEGEHCLVILPGRARPPARDPP